MFDLRNFFSSSFTVSIMVLFLNNNLSDMLMSAPSYCSSVSLPTDSVDKKTLEQTFAYIPFVRYKPAIQELHKSLVFKRFPVIYVARRYHEVQKFPFPVAYDVQLEAEELTHGTFVPLGHTQKHLVDMDALVATHP